MKKITALFLLLVLSQSGCKKDLQQLPDKPFGILRQSNCQIEVTTACGNTMLSFPSQQAYDNAYDCLFEEYENWNDQFDAQHASLNDDDLNDLIDATGWNEEQTLVDFENSQTLVSLRSKLRAEELIWLSTGLFDPATDPNNHYIDDPVEQALLNEYGMIMIAGEIRIFLEDGSIYRITNGDCNLAMNVASNPNSVSDPNVVVVSAASNPDDDCKFKEKNSRDTIWTGDGNKKYKWYLRFKKGYTQSEACVKIVNFRRKSNTSNWRPLRTLCDVEVSGRSRSLDNCAQSDSISIGCPRVLLNQNYCASKKRNRRTGTSKLGRVAKVNRLDIMGYIEAGNTVTRRFLNW
jgi:hypothetical protein